MARGWESKSVEDQITSAEERRSRDRRGVGTFGDRDAHVRTANLRLARAKIVQDLENAINEDYRFSLKQALAYLDAQLDASGAQDKEQGVSDEKRSSVPDDRG